MLRDERSEKSALATSPEGREAGRRDDERHMTVLRVGKIVARGRQILCLIRNISSGGLMAHIFSPLDVEEALAIELKTGQVVSGKVVWTRDNKVGIAFDGKINVSEILSTHVNPEDSARVSRAPRLDVHSPARVRVGARYYLIEILDISQGGAKIAPGSNVNVGDEIVVMVDGFAPWPGVVRWAKEAQAGISFNQPIPLDQLAIWAATHCKTL